MEGHRPCSLAMSVVIHCLRHLIHALHLLPIVTRPVHDGNHKDIRLTLGRMLQAQSSGPLSNLSSKTLVSMLGSMP